MCLLAYSGSRLQIITSIEGNVSPGEVIRAMQQAVDEQGALMVAERVERDQIVSSAHLKCYCFRGKFWEANSVFAVGHCCLYVLSGDFPSVYQLYGSE